MSSRGALAQAPTKPTASEDANDDDRQRRGIEIIGTRLQPVRWVWDAIGTPPRNLRERRAWSEKVPRRVHRAYAAEGYEYARAWVRLEEDGTGMIEVDEGKLDQVVFVGANMLYGLQLQWNMHLPGNVFHRPTAEAQLRDLEARYDLAQISFEVREDRSSKQTKTGFVAPDRVMAIQLSSRERFGWSIGIRTSPQWGVLPYGGIRGRDWIWDEDRFTGEAGVSVPYRQFLFEEEPQWRWLHGHVEMDYRFPPFAEIFAPDIDARLDSSIYRRGDIGVVSYHELEAQARVGLAFLILPELTVTLAGGVNWIYATALNTNAELRVDTHDTERIRGVVSLVAETDYGDNRLRGDLRDSLRLEAKLAVSDLGELLGDTRATYRWTKSFGSHDLIVSGRGLWVGGDVKFWDEVALAGDYSRIFFEGRYWVRTALQTQLAFRLSLSGEKIKIGVFNDLSVFGDRSTETMQVGLAEGGGPSLHFVLFNVIALDLYYAFGSDRRAFAHNFAFSVGTVY